MTKYRSDEFDALMEEIADAHAMLDELGVGKRHFSLAGRIELMAAMAIADKLNLDSAIDTAVMYYGDEMQLREHDTERLAKLLHILADMIKQLGRDPTVVWKMAKLAEKEQDANKN